MVVLREHEGFCNSHRPHRALDQAVPLRPLPIVRPVGKYGRGQAGQQGVLRPRLNAVAAGQLGPEADSDEAIYLVSTLIVGVLSQAMANEPGLGWGEGRFTSQFPRLMKLLIAAYPPGTPGCRSGAMESLMTDPRWPRGTANTRGGR